MMRNYIWINNPVYPLYVHWFNPQNVALQSSLSLFKILGNCKENKFTGRGLN